MKRSTPFHDFGGLCLVVFDSRGAITRVNARAADLLGVPAEKVVGAPVHTVLAPNMSLFEEWIASALCDDRVAESFEVGSADAQGNRRVVRWNHVAFGFGRFRKRFLVGFEITDHVERMARDQMFRYTVSQAERVSRVGSYSFDCIADQWTGSEMLDEILGIDDDYRRDAEGALAFVHPDDREEARLNLQECLWTGGGFDQQLRILRPSDGAIRWIHVRGEQFAGPDTRRMIGTVQDVTETREAAEVLRRSEEMLRSAERIGHVGSWTRDVSTDVLWCSDELYTILGLTRGEREINVDDYVACVHPDDRAGVVEGTRLSPEPGVESAAFYRIVRPDGEVRYVTSRMETMRDSADGSWREVGMLADTTELQHAATRMREYQAQLRAMAARLGDSSDATRRELAVQLHDEVSQPLAAALMHLELLRRESAGERPGECDIVIELIHEALKASRDLTTDMAPPILYELGVVPALEWLGEHFYERFGLTCTVTSGGITQIDSPVDAALVFRIARELLTNVSKHADTDGAEVHVEADGEILLLTVTDQGRGFYDVTLGRDTFGLLSVREAVELRGGMLSIDSQWGVGSCVRVWIPLGVDVAGSGVSAGEGGSGEAQAVLVDA